MHQTAMYLIACTLFSFALQCRSDVAVMTNSVQVAAELAQDDPKSLNPKLFDLTVTVIFPPIPPYDSIKATDAAGFVSLKDRMTEEHPALQTGDMIRARGQTGVERGTPVAKCSRIEVLSHTNLPPPAVVAAKDFFAGRCDQRVIQIVGVVKDVFRDEVDRGWTFIVIDSKDGAIYAASPALDINSGNLQPLIGAEVAVTGFCSTTDRGLRRQIGRILLVHDLGSIRTIRSPAADPFNVPEAVNSRRLRPIEISNMGRRRTSGRVLAVWGGNMMLLRRNDGSIMRVELSDGSPPECGASIEVAGFPETDLYRINLTRAIWRAYAIAGIPGDETPVDVAARDVITENQDRNLVRYELHGRAIRIKGNVRSLPSTESNGRFYIEDGSLLVPIETGTLGPSVHNMDVGCRIEVTGICVMDIENWRPNSVFPQIKGFMVVVRTPEDIKVISRPPWWTARRLMAVIGALLTALAGIFIWNRMLNRRAEKRGKELAEEKVAHVTSDLKVYERTRLAVELHDSLSQNLTGVSLAIRAANRLADSDPDGMRQSLNLASKTLDSCRDELRNCLWDLRNQTLEEASMDEAIRQTLKPHVGSAQLSIRFNVPRERLSDNTAHAILRIVRELASNAIRHGGATEIKVAGAIEGDRLLFSVTDNGRGFDPESRPGVKDGHFGLQGIQDRVDGFEGDMSISSVTDRGTKITISLTLSPLQSATPNP